MWTNAQRYTYASFPQPRVRSHRSPAVLHTATSGSGIEGARRTAHPRLVCVSGCVVLLCALHTAVLFLSSLFLESAKSRLANGWVAGKFDAPPCRASSPARNMGAEAGCAPAARMDSAVSSRRERGRQMMCGSSGAARPASSALGAASRLTVASSADEGAAAAPALALHVHDSTRASSRRCIRNDVS